VWVCIWETRHMEQRKKLLKLWKFIASIFQFAIKSRNIISLIYSSMHLSFSLSIDHSTDIFWSSTSLCIGRKLKQKHQHAKYPVRVAFVCKMQGITYSVIMMRNCSCARREIAIIRVKQWNNWERK
jgi:hypothetical protein